MGFLKLLEGIRNPVLDNIFLLVTALGEELVFTTVILGTLWCINKKMGFWMFFSWGTGTSTNQLIKAMCHVPRPWVQDPGFSAVERALEGATGYSFPSGHTQSAFGLFGSLALFIKSKGMTIIAIILIALTGFSRMYLGVHTPADVLVAVIIGFAVLILMAWFIRIEEKKPWISWVACAILIAVSVALLIYSSFFAGGMQDKNIAAAAENAWKLLGAALGLTVAWQADRIYINFDTKAVWYVQILKLLIGAVIVFLIRTLLKQPLLNLFNGSLVADMVRYFILTVFAGIIYPLTFKYFARIGSTRKYEKAESKK